MHRPLPRKWAEQFAKTDVCPECKGARLNKEALHFRIHDKNIYELASMDINELYDWLQQVDPFPGRQAAHDCRRDFEGDPYPS